MRKKTHPARSERYGNINIGVPSIFTKDIFDYGANRFVSQSEIKEIEKREDKTFASDKELDQEADKNRAYNDKKQEENLVAGLREKLEPIFR